MSPNSSMYNIEGIIMAMYNHNMHNNHIDSNIDNERYESIKDLTVVTVSKSFHTEMTKALRNIFGCYLQWPK